VLCLSVLKTVTAVGIKRGNFSVWRYSSSLIVGIKQLCICQYNYSQLPEERSRETLEHSVTLTFHVTETLDKILV
jgi:hypothetical protein